MEDIQKSPLKIAREIPFLGCIVKKEKLKELVSQGLLIIKDRNSDYKQFKKI